MGDGRQCGKALASRRIDRGCRPQRKLGLGVSGRSLHEVGCLLLPELSLCMLGRSRLHPSKLSLSICRRPKAFFLIYFLGSAALGSGFLWGERIYCNLNLSFRALGFFLPVIRKSSSCVHAPQEKCYWPSPTPERRTPIANYTDLFIPT
jgi:hypothetical protein